MKPAICRVLIGSFSLILWFSLECSAQQASSFEQLQVLVKPGDNVYVTDFAGKTLKGRIAALSPSSLGLIVDGVRRDWLQNDVREIRQWRGDSLVNGAIIGAAAGAGIGIIPAIYCQGECNEAVALTALLCGGLGAGVGVGIDALIPAKQSVFRNKTLSSLERLHIRPILSRSTKGVQIAFSF
jgi:hypothetical protein